MFAMDCSGSSDVSLGDFLLFECDRPRFLHDKGSYSRYFSVRAMRVLEPGQARHGEIPASARTGRSSEGTGTIQANVRGHGTRVYVAGTASPLAVQLRTARRHIHGRQSEVIALRCWRSYGFPTREKHMPQIVKEAMRRVHASGRDEVQLAKIPRELAWKPMLKLSPRAAPTGPL